MLPLNVLAEYGLNQFSQHWFIVRDYSMLAQCLSTCHHSLRIFCLYFYPEATKQFGMLLTGFVENVFFSTQFTCHYELHVMFS